MASSFVDTDTVLRWLLDSAQAIEDGNLKRADAFLQLILILADERPYQFRVQSRVVKYFAEALVRRAYGLHPASSNFTFPVNPAPYYLRSRNSIDGVIKKVIDDALMGNRRLHLIDFSIPSKYYLRTQFSVHCPTSPAILFPSVDARKVNVKLEDEPKVGYANSLAEVGECEIDFKRSRDDEMVVVYYKFKLDKLVRDAKAMERELVRLKEINPTIVIMLDFYSNHTHSNFLTCFKDSFQYSLKTLDCWPESEFVVDEYKWELSRDVGEGNNVIRRYQTLSEWQRLFSMAGFTRIPLNHNEDNLGYESPFFGSIFGSFGDTSFLEIMREEEECLILGYNESPMFFLSAWKPKVEDGHFNSISTDHKFGQGAFLFIFSNYI
ncbi:hypothetical protein Godav_012885 [Gossypium davidsonii]|uniref:DELLA protein n=1 Tax=Gossypium davidsonii TaxID=34287 RepID=A0A7J8REJ4_GOSDV|nr:hypothetical protein [Gossypium davidsonii]